MILFDVKEKTKYVLREMGTNQANLSFSNV